MVGMGFALDSVMETWRRREGEWLKVLRLLGVCDTYNSSSFSLGVAVRGGRIRLLESRVVGRRRLHRQNTHADAHTAKIQSNSSDLVAFSTVGILQTDLWVFVPLDLLRRLLLLLSLCRWQRSLCSRSSRSIEGVLCQAVGLLLGAAGGVGRHVVALHRRAAGRRRRRLGFQLFVKRRRGSKLFIRPCRWLTMSSFACAFF